MNIDKLFWQEVALSQGFTSYLKLLLRFLVKNFTKMVALKIARRHRSLSCGSGMNQIGIVYLKGLFYFRVRLQRAGLIQLTSMVKGLGQQQTSSFSYQTYQSLSWESLKVKYTASTSLVSSRQKSKKLNQARASRKSTLNFYSLSITLIHLRRKSPKYMKRGKSTSWESE